MAESLEGATMPNGKAYEDWVTTSEGQRWLKDKEARMEDEEEDEEDDEENTGPS